MAWMQEDCPVPMQSDGKMKLHETHGIFYFFTPLDGALG